jgi:hypothetical protein
VTADGKNLVSHAGTALLTELADRTGLTRAMSGALDGCGISWNTHEPGVVLTHLAVAIADGANCLSDFEVLREQSELFGDVASISTAWRAVKATTSLELRRIRTAMAAAREIVWVSASLIAGALLASSQMTCLDGELTKAEPKAIRYRILHVAALLVRRGGRLILRLDETWPWAAALQRAFLKLRATFP